LQDPKTSFNTFGYSDALRPGGVYCIDLSLGGEATQTGSVLPGIQCQKACDVLGG